jgi:hypothetical protein
MGFGGLHGVAVTLGTYKAPGYPGNNFVATSIEAAGGQLRFQWPHAVEIGPLRTGTQTVRAEVTPSGGTYVLLVWLNGQQILQQPEPSLTPTSLLAFTGGTGPLTDIHTVRDVAISATK